MNNELTELEYLRRELAGTRTDLAAAEEENANLLARLQNCQELSGRLPMSEVVVFVGELFVRDMTAAIAEGGSFVHVSMLVRDARLLLDALRPFFGNGAT